MTEKTETRVLRAAGKDDQTLLFYETRGQLAVLRVDAIVGVRPYEKENSIICFASTTSLCDSTTAEVLAVLGWH